MFRLIAAAGAVFLALLATGPPESIPRLILTTQPVPLNPADPAQVTVGRLRYRGGLHISGVNPTFGGLSDVRVLDEGRLLVAVSDCGSGFLARLRYDPQGNLVGLDEGRTFPLAAPGGRRLEGGEQDAESLALAPDRALIVGFEQRHRLWRYPPGAAPFALAPDPLQVPPGSAALEANKGFEAALALEDGRLVVLSEAPTGHPRMAAGWIESGAVWEAFEYPLVYAEDSPDEPFRPTAMARLPGGDVVVAERRYPPVAVRLRLVPRASLEAGRGLEGTELARLAPPLTVDNLEGLDIAPGPDREPRFYLLSDDNDCAKDDHRHGTSRQRTLLLSFSLTP
ncbi:MAG TPA: esterase-like activity of phytase family protein [Vicinamibacteria bacterium]